MQFTSFKSKILANDGLSMIEILTVIAILAILIILAITTLPRQLEKARDGERKSDLKKIKVAFENYYDDEGCYPSPDILELCGANTPPTHELSKYLQDIPCDPGDESYYLYLPYDKTGSTGTCDGYRVWANLEKNDDPVVATLNCDSASGCGAYDFFTANPPYPGGPQLGPESSEYNYGVSEGVPVFTGDANTYLDSGWCCGGTACNSWTMGGGVCANGPYITYDECVASSPCSS